MSEPYFNTRRERDAYEALKDNNAITITDSVESFVSKISTWKESTIVRFKVLMQVKNYGTFTQKQVTKKVTALFSAAVKRGFIKRIGLGVYKVI